MKLFLGSDIIGNQKIFSIYVSLVNAISSGDDRIVAGSTASVTVQAVTGYSLPAEISVTGASYTWDQSTGVITLSNPTANVQIEVAAV